MTDKEKLSLISRICRSTKHLEQIRDILTVAESEFMDDSPEKLLRAFTVDGHNAILRCELNEQSI